MCVHKKPALTPLTERLKECHQTSMFRMPASRQETARVHGSLPEIMSVRAQGSLSQWSARFVIREELVFTKWVIFGVKRKV